VLLASLFLSKRRNEKERQRKTFAVAWEQALTPSRNFAWLGLGLGASAANECFPDMNADDPNDPSDPRHPHNWAHRAHLIDGGVYTPSISGSPHCDSRALLNESAVQRMMEAGKKLGPAPQPSPYSDLKRPADAKNGGDHDAFFDDDDALYADLPLDLSSEKSSLQRTSKDDKYSSRDGVSGDLKRAAEDDGDDDDNSNKRSWSTHTHANVYNNPTDVPGDSKRTSNDYQCSNNNIHTCVPGDVEQVRHGTVYPSAVESTSHQNWLGPLPPPLPILVSPGLASQLEPIPAGMQKKVQEFLQTKPPKKCDTEDDYKARVLECKLYGRKLTGTWNGKNNTAADTWICHVELKHKLFLRINVDGSETLWTCDDHGKWKRNVHTDMFRDPAFKLYRRLWWDKSFFDEWNKSCRKNPRTNLDGGFTTVAKAFLIVGRGKGQFEGCLKNFWNSDERKACEQQYRAEQHSKSTPQPRGATYNFSPGAIARGALSPGATLLGDVHNHYYNLAGSPPAAAPTFNNNNNSNEDEDDKPEAVLPAPAPSFNNGSSNNNNGNGPGTYTV